MPFPCLARSGRLLLSLIAALSVPAALDAGDWTNWRGPNHDGISAETDIRVSWSESPRVLWEREVGSAFSAVTGAGERVYTCGTRGGKQVLLCLDATKGDEVWASDIEKELEERQGGDGTRATPAVHGGKVWVLGAHGRLLCADAATGREVWSRTFGNKPSWAYSGSVLIEGDLAVVSPGEEDGALLALDKDTGLEVWKAGDDEAGYATPYPFTFEGERYIAGFLAERLLVVAAKSGEEVWSTKWKTSYDVNAATPIFHDGRLFISSGYGTGAALFRLEKKGAKLDAETVWRSKVIRSKFQTCILWGGHLYGADESSLKCVDFLTGRELWSERRVEGRSTQHGTVAMAGGHIFFLTGDGWLFAAKASPEGFRPTASARPLRGRCWTVPTIHEGRLFVRSLDTVVCLDLRK